MIVLGIESSCDETGVAIASTSNGLIAHALHSQISMHKEYGGVVPELASRDHIRRILPLTEQVLIESGLQKEDIGAIAYTAGPGLAGALLAGSSVAKSIAWSLQVPAIPVHHLEGHLLSPLMDSPAPEFPFVALLVSGGHTQLMQVNDVGNYKILGETLDDAAGEAFDKTAMLLGLGYPGGPALSRLAQKGNSRGINLPRPMLHSKDLDFSFSGLKTAVLTINKKMADETLNSGNIEQRKADLAAATEQAIGDILIAKSIKAMRQTGMKTLVVAGGVGANSYLRKNIKEQVKLINGEVYFPPLEFCTDNGAMIAFAAVQRINKNLINWADLSDSFSIKPRWNLTDICTFNNATI